MGKGDMFALQNTRLGEFLQAPVGIELNGSTLTVLSMLARLNLDPWVEAASWAKLPRQVATARLTQSIGLMPLSPHALAAASATASRLTLLLPGPSAAARTAPAEGPPTALQALLARAPSWAPMVAVLAALIIGFAVSGLVTWPAPIATSPHITGTRP